MLPGPATVVSVTYAYVMTTTLELDLAAPDAVAGVVDAVNDRLAAETHVPAEVAAEVAGFAAAVRATSLARWTAADPYLALLVHRAVLDAQAAVDGADRDALRIALARLGHALAALGEAEEVGDERTPKELARWLAAAVDVPQRDLAALLGVDLRRFQRWISPRERTRPEGEEASRLRAVARLVGQLRHAYTAAGVLAWFDRPQRALGGAAPRELLADPLRLPDLMLAAGAVRSTAFA